MGKLFSITGKRVLVTGSGAGIGEACANAFAAQGAKVCANSASRSAERVAEKIRAHGDTCIFVQADVQDPEQVRHMVDMVAEQFGGLDVLVNCAGVVVGGSIEETDLATWNHVMAVNVTGVYLTCKAAMPHLKVSKGCITNITSLVAIKGIASRAAYSASKGAVLSLSRAMAADYLKDGVRVNCVCPGTVLSPSLQQRIDSEPDPEAAYHRYVSRQPMGRLGTPEEIAAAVIYTCSAEAGFLNGVNLPVDGAGSL